MSLNEVWLHIALNHLPIVGIPLVLVFLAASLKSSSEKLTKFSLMVLSFLCLVSVAVFFSGEAAEEVVEKAVSENLLEAHEDMGKIALISCLILGGLSILSLLLSKTKLFRFLIGLVFVVGLGAMGVLGYAAHLGGQVRHPDIRDGSAPTVPHEEEHESEPGE